MKWSWMFLTHDKMSEDPSFREWERVKEILYRVSAIADVDPEAFERLGLTEILILVQARADKHWLDFMRRHPVCARPECRNQFKRSRDDRVYCSPHCQAAVKQKEYRARKKQERKEKEGKEIDGREETSFPLGH